MTSVTLTLAQARKLALRAQGFGLDVRHSDPGWRQLKRQLYTMRNLQIDAINTVIRSHYTPLFSRLGAYDRNLLDHHVFRPRKAPGNRAFFEYWGHECSVLPIELYPMFRWRMDDARAGVGVYKQLKQLVTRKPAFVQRIREHIQDRHLTCRDLNMDRRGPGMWEWSESKQALEYLFWTGEVASVGRRRFERVYGIPDTVIPPQILNTPAPDRVDAQADLLELAAKAMGIATETDLRDYFRLSAVDAGRALQQLIEQKRLQPAAVKGWSKPAYLLPDTSLPRKLDTAAILSPFDPVVWHRERAARLFDFNYRIEIYVPEKKRRYGYWVMPFLLDDRVVGRLDLKADREAQTLLVKGAWAEEGVDMQRVVPVVQQELEHLAQWLGLTNVSYARRGDLARGLYQKRI